MKRTGVLIILLFLGFFILTRPALIFEDRKGEILYLLPLFQGGAFHTVYIHSVEKTPVLEYFQVEGRVILLKKTAFSSYGAGLPLHWNGFQQEGGSFVVQDINTQFSTIHFRVSGTPDQYLVGDGREILFQDLALQGERLSIRGGPLYSFVWDYLTSFFKGGFPEE